MPKIPQLVKVEQSPISTDFNGNDAAIRDVVQLRAQVVQFAVRAMPEVVRKCLFIIETSKSNKDIIEAAKFIKSVSDGQALKVKTINGIVKKMSDKDLSASLESEAQFDEE